MRINMLRVLPVLIAATVTLTILGCSNGPAALGVAIPGDAQVAKLADVLGNPATYDGKQVIIKGRVSGQCPSLCEFFMKDGAHKVTIFPQGYAFPKLETGKPVTVYAAVTAGPQNVVLNALGVRFDKE